MFLKAATVLNTKQTGPHKEDLVRGLLRRKEEERAVMRLEAVTAAPRSTRDRARLPANFQGPRRFLYGVFSRLPDAHSALAHAASLPFHPALSATALPSPNERVHFFLFVSDTASRKLAHLLNLR